MTASKHQQGVVLIVSLILLLLITLISVSGMKNTILEEKMAGNYKDKNSAFQAGEAALREAEASLDASNIEPFFDDVGTTTGHYLPTKNGLPRWQSVNWDGIGDVITFSGALSGIPDSPKYIIEQLDPIQDPGGPVGAGELVTIKYYRITTQATGSTDTAEVTLQSTFKR
jgi:type IV pilus assembly protein PilX